jgi:hypothetical protein
MSSNNIANIDYATIIGFSLFAISEIVPLLPIHANGILHSFVIGLTKSFNLNLPAKQTTDLEANKNTELNELPENSSLSPLSPPLHNTHYCKNCHSDLNDILLYLNQNPEKLKNIKDFISSQNE